jgi:DNA polymerase III alpha subunit (gram-positive type)
MEVNKIDLVKHAQIATELNEARQQFVNFVTAGIRATGVRKLIPAGHNVKFDMRFIWHHMLAEEPWGMYCTYPEFDTASIARYLNSAGKISGGCSLSVLRERFGIHTGDAHDAEVDNLATIELAKKFMEFLPATT